MWRKLIIAVLVVAVMASFFTVYLVITPPAMRGMGGMQAVEGPHVPLVRGYAAGEEILFIHTEASSEPVAEILSEMMGSPVLLVLALAEAPEALLAIVYVFQNGVAGDGPFGFQPDVFDRHPGEQGYSPLRLIHFVNWREGVNVRLLRSADEVRQTETQGDLTIERTGSVVNMPMVTWPGGQR